MGLLDGVAVRIDLVAVAVALVAGVGDVVLTSLILDVDDNRGDRRGEFAVHDVIHREVDPIDGHCADARHREDVPFAVGGYRRRAFARSVHPGRDFVTRPVLVGAPEVEAGVDGLGGVEIAGHGHLRRDHGGPGPDGLVPRGAEGVEGDVVRGVRTVEDADLDFDGDVRDDLDLLAGVAGELVVDHDLARLHDVARLGAGVERGVHDELGHRGRDRRVVAGAVVAGLVLVGPGGLVAGVAGRVAGAAADEGEAEEGEDADEGTGHDAPVAVKLRRSELGPKKVRVPRGTLHSDDSRKLAKSKGKER